MMLSYDVFVIASQLMFLLIILSIFVVIQGIKNILEYSIQRFIIF